MFFSIFKGIDDVDKQGNLFPILVMVIVSPAFGQQEFQKLTAITMDVAEFQIW